MSNVFLELNNYNSENTEKDAVLTYKSGNIIDEENTKCWPVKFSLTSSNFPLFVPTIVRDWQPFYPVGATQQNTTIIGGQPNYYNTEWVITLETVLKTGSRTFSTAPVQWRPWDSYIPDIKYDKDGIAMPTTLINTKYFWCNDAIQICDYINDTLASLTTNPNQIIFSKDADRWSLLYDTEMFSQDIMQVIVHFNEPMRRYFNFYYKYNGTGIIHSPATVILNDLQYFTQTTSSTNNLLFPFDKIVFVSSTFPAYPQFVENTNSTIINFSESILLSFDLNISDISEIGNSISFTSESKDRSLQLSKQFLSNFTVTVYLHCRDGFMFPLKLQKLENICFLLMFH